MTTEPSVLLQKPTLGAESKIFHVPVQTLADSSHHLRWLHVTRNFLSWCPLWLGMKLPVLVASRPIEALSLSSTGLLDYLDYLKEATYSKQWAVPSKSAAPSCKKSEFHRTRDQGHQISVVKGGTATQLAPYHDLMVIKLYQTDVQF